MHLTSCGTLVILITSFGEFPFIILLPFFLVHFTVKKKKQCCRIVFGACPVLLQGVSSSGLEIVNQG